MSAEYEAACEVRDAIRGPLADAVTEGLNALDESAAALLVEGLPDRRERIATTVLSGLAVGNQYSGGRKAEDGPHVAKIAVAWADALIAALDAK